MNYIYDIYLNLNNTLYDFFDWNKSDKLIHIKKIPIYILDEDGLKFIINNIVKIDNPLLNSIKNKTTLWNQNDNISYCSLFSDCNTIIAVEFNKSGISIKKSFLLVDEELEILESISTLKPKNINFELVKKDETLLKTRKQIKDENFVDKELKNIDSNKLNYIYFECFGKKENNEKIIINNIKKLSKNSITYKNLYSILKLTSKTKNKMI